jgi:Uncharacterized protein conserved in bacteria
VFLRLFEALRRERVPVTVREWLDLLAALQAGVGQPTPEGLHALARTVLVKDERHYDRFDRAFGHFLGEVAAAPDEALAKVIPEDWLNDALQRQLSDEEKAGLQQVGSLDELMKKFAERLAEQHERHEGGNRWIGTGGTSPFGIRAGTRAACAWAGKAATAARPRSGRSAASPNSTAMPSWARAT